MITTERLDAAEQIPRGMIIPHQPYDYKYHHPESFDEREVRLANAQDYLRAHDATYEVFEADDRREECAEYLRQICLSSKFGLYEPLREEQLDRWINAHMSLQGASTRVFLDGTTSQPMAAQTIYAPNFSGLDRRLQRWLETKYDDPEKMPFMYCTGVMTANGIPLKNHQGHGLATALWMIARRDMGKTLTENNAEVGCIFSRITEMNTASEISAWRAGNVPLGPVMFPNNEAIPYSTRSWMNLRFWRSVVTAPKNAA